MKQSLLLIIHIFFFSPLFSQSAIITEISGRVEIQLPGSTSWTRVHESRDFPIGATISAGLRSGAEIRIDDTLIIIEQLTRLTLEELIEIENNRRTELALPVGRVRAEVQSRQGLQQEFQLRSPVVTAAVRGTGFEFDGNNITVERGTVRIINKRNQSIDVSTGESSFVDEISSPTNPKQLFEQLSSVNPSTNRFTDSRSLFNTVAEQTEGFLRVIFPIEPDGPEF